MGCCTAVSSIQNTHFAEQFAILQHRQLNGAVLAGFRQDDLTLDDHVSRVTGLAFRKYRLAIAVGSFGVLQSRPRDLWVGVGRGSPISLIIPYNPL